MNFKRTKNVPGNGSTSGAVASAGPDAYGINSVYHDGLPREK